MNILLDTHTFLWQIGAQEQSKLGQQARHLMQTADTVYVSSLSLVEIHIKSMIGKITAPADCQSEAIAAGDALLAFSPAAADALTIFPGLARHDPFDRMLLAQAYADHLTLMTADRVLLGLGLPYVRDSRV